MYGTISIKNYFQKRRKKCQIIFKNRIILAWKLLCDSCAKLIGFIKKFFVSEDFISRHKSSPQDFTRKRQLPFDTLICFLINLPKGSYQDELDHLFKAINHSECFERIVSKSALCKARNKLKYESFIELNQHAVGFFYEKFSPLKWYGFNLLAIDGSTVRLPNTEEVIKHFGPWEANSPNQRPVARISQLFDVLNKITVDAIISPKEKGERELAHQHFINLMLDDLILMDRGYPAYWLYQVILSMQANFCARVPVSSSKIIKKFYNSEKKEKIISFPASYQSKEKCVEMGLNTEPLKLRLIRIELESGETEILITSLLDQDKYPLEIFSELYHERWPIEEDYKVMKSRIEIENFTGKSVLSVYQDFHAKVLSKNITAILAFPTALAIMRKLTDRKYLYRFNFTQTLSKMKDTIVVLFNRSESIVKELITKLHKIIIETIEPVRPGRKYPREHNIQCRDFCPSYKPIR